MLAINGLVKMFGIGDFWFQVSGVGKAAQKLIPEHWNLFYIHWPTL